MAVPTAITTGVQTVTATGPVAPTTGLNVAGVTGDFTLAMRVVGLTAGKTTRVQLEGSTNAFTNSIPIWNEQFIGGPIGEPADIRLSTRRYQIPNSLSSDFGFASDVIRANVIELDAGATLELTLWIEQ